MLQLLVAGIVSFVPPQEVDRIEAWNQDVMKIVEEAERLHPDLYFSVSADEFHAAVDSLFGRIPELTDDEIVVELMRLFAMVSRDGRDGSTTVSAYRRFSFLPIRFYRFSDGWFVTESTADPALIGLRLQGIEGTPVAEAYARLAVLQSKDNEYDLMGRVALLMVRPELLHLSGLTAEPARATYQLLDAEGAVREVTLDGAPFDRTGFKYPWWGPRLPEDAELPWLAKHEGSWDHRVLEDAGAVYVRYDSVFAQEDGGRTQVEFLDQFMGAAREAGADRIVIDLRSNGGGDERMFRPLVDGLRDSPWNRRGGLFLLTGRATFGAGAAFATAMRAETEALLIGEPTGGSPTGFGEAKWVRLPDRKDLFVRISSAPPAARHRRGADDQRARPARRAVQQRLLRAPGSGARGGPGLLRVADSGRRGADPRGGPHVRAGFGRWQGRSPPPS